MKRLGIIILPIIMVAVFIATGMAAETSKEPLAQPINTAILPEPLPVVGSYENLKSLLRKTEASQYNMRYSFGVRDGVMLEAMPAASMAKSADQAATLSGGNSGTASDYSQTNVQVEGVDEADIVKTDGEYIYHLGRNRINVIKATPNMQLVYEMPFSQEEFQPLELYVDNKNLVVIGYSYLQLKPQEDYKDPTPADAKTLLPPGKYPPVITKQTTKAVIFNIEDKSQIQKVREVELEGGYLSSRKIGSSLYLVTNKYADMYHILHAESSLPEQQILPIYRDSIEGKGFSEIGYDKIYYFPGVVEPNYLIIGSLDLSKPDAKMNTSTYLGAGNSLYSSLTNLYIAVSEYEYSAQPEPLLPKKAGEVEPGMPSEPRIMRPPKVNTAIYKFSLEKDATVYVGKGQVPGSILNQFSMDEYAGYFRIATTIDQFGADQQFTSSNNLYILDSDLELTGKIENIAPGERIYSTRFMGERGYMVTFKTVDPLFVLDLKDPKNPKILGELKIPGYSDYLHPYDENHLIGFGKDAIEMKNPWSNGAETIAYYQGMKVALFDISDVNNPIEKFSIKIGDRGTESELLHNHKALLFAKNKNLLAFPVAVAEVNDNVKEPGIPDELRYGQMTFQGAYIYNLSLDKGFDLKARITHLTTHDLVNFYKGAYPYPNDLFVERIIMIGNNLYTTSKGKIMAHEMSEFNGQGIIEMPRKN